MIKMHYDFLHHRDREPFENIKAGKKTFEIRLCDEKRSKIKVGDIIKIVSRLNENDFLFVKVVELSRFESFNSLYKKFGEKIKNYEKAILSKVYSEEQEKKYGVLVIHFEKIESELF